MNSKDFRRNNTVEEKEVARGNCALPKWLSVLIFVLSIQYIALGLFLLILGYSAFFGSVCFAIGIVLLPFWIIFQATIKKCHCVITNKRIYGTKAVFIIKQQYSYRLDMIDQIEVNSSLGFHYLTMRFRGDGAIGQNPIMQKRGEKNGTFVISFLKEESANELYQKISEEISNIKNDKDVQIELELRKNEIEEKKTEAFVAMAQNISGENGKNTNNGDDYIAQIERLNKLKENGIITEDEFQKKKKELLSK